MLRRAARR
uniref:Uncharacterized protein n=1 Tax=Rhizophora mucronata TaxID=61149 RepID=A0A2P2PH43_RHIMU